MERLCRRYSYVTSRPVVRTQELMMRCGGAYDAVRWARCLAEVLKLATLLCPGAVQAAYANITSRIQARRCIA